MGRISSVLGLAVSVVACAAVRSATAHAAAEPPASQPAASRPAWFAEPVAVVDGVPIASGKVWDLLRSPLAVEGRRAADAAAFRALAAKYVRQQVAALVEEEQQTIDARARATPAQVEQARSAADAWRNLAILEAGSVEAAERVVAEQEGTSLDQAAEERVRLALLQGVFGREMAAMPPISDEAVRARYAAWPDYYADRNGRIRKLEDPAVREAVVRRLREEQITGMRERQLARARKVSARTDAAAVDRLVDEAVRRHFTAARAAPPP